MMIRAFRRFPNHERGNVSAIFGLVLPAIVVAVAGTVDYGGLLSTRAQMQGAADMAALAGAKEMRLAHADPTFIASSAKAQVLATLGAKGAGANIQTSVIGGNTVTVTIDLVRPSLFGGLAPVKLSHIQVQAVAHTANSTSTCLIALDPKGKGVKVENAAISSNGCSTYSDSQKKDGLSVNKGAISASQTCSAGGFQNNGGDVVPAPLLDCPVISDPLASRPPPVVGSCMYNKTVIAGGSVTLFPGTYCDGISVTQGATANLAPGLYIISKGKFNVDKGSTLKGTDVGFFLTNDAEIIFDFVSTISLTAPKSGPLAGILFFEDRLTKGKKHNFSSRDMPMLLGTLYFPQSSLVIGAKPPGPYETQTAADIAACAALSLAYPCAPSPSTVASQSAWTIVIASDIDVNFVTNLVLNTNYSGTSNAPPAEIPIGMASLAK